MKVRVHKERKLHRIPIQSVVSLLDAASGSDGQELQVL
jgi:hypothetical protein